MSHNTEEFRLLYLWGSIGIKPLSFQRKFIVFQLGWGAMKILHFVQENCFVAAICHQLIYLDGTGPNWSRFRCVYTLSVSSVRCHYAAVERSTVSPLIHVNQAQDWPDFVMSNAKQHCIDNFCQDTLSDRNLSLNQCWERWTNLSGICEGALVFALIF